MADSARKFHRASAPVRREALIEATLVCLRKLGHAGVSVRRISAEAGVSPGLINHHFPSVATLVAAAYERLALSLLESIRRHAEAPNSPARERLRRFFEASFTPQMLDPTLFNTWLVFWSTISHDAEMRAVHDRTWGAYREVLESLLRELAESKDVPSFDVRRAAIGLSALLDGLWIESSLNPRTIAPAEAIALCEDWTDALCAGSARGTPGVPHRAARAQ
jgi:TetR/AcrR family transcriptional regulator, transcriptional repressor of bet genes